MLNKIAERTTELVGACKFEVLYITEFFGVDSEQDYLYFFAIVAVYFYGVAERICLEQLGLCLATIENQVTKTMAVCRGGFAIDVYVFF